MATHIAHPIDHPIFDCVIKGNLNEVRRYIDNGFMIDANQNLLLCVACEYGKLDIIKYLVEECKVDVSIGYPVLWSIRSCDDSVLEYILIAGGDFRVYDDAAIIYAVNTGKKDIVMLLLMGGINVDAYNGYAMKIACKKQYDDIIALLLTYGASFD